MKTTKVSKQWAIDMRNEDMYLLYLKQVERKSREEGEAEATKKFEGIIEQKDQELEQKNINFVHNTYNAGISVENIAKYTNLTTQQVLNIINPKPVTP